MWIAVRITAALLLLGAIGAYGWYQVWTRPVERIRYRVDVVVDTPSGRSRGTGVLGIYTVNVLDLPSSTASVRMRGQAIPVALGGGRTLWMTIAHPGFEWQAGAPWLGDFAMRPGVANRMDERMIPPMVVFADENRPETVRSVDHHDLARTFGKGYSLRGVYVSATDAPVTTGVDDRLPWAVHRPGELDGKRRWAIDVRDPAPASYMTGRYFVSEPD